MAKAKKAPAVPQSTVNHQLPAHLRAPIDVPPPVNLRGVIDAVVVAEKFVQVRGWVCALDDNQADIPLTFAFRGTSYGGYGLHMRDDLAAAGIADGSAAFDVILPIDNAELGVDYEFDITDTGGRTCTLRFPGHRVERFLPRGSMDEVNARVISGWVFDPFHDGGAARPAFYFEDEFLCRVIPIIDRTDLSFDLGDGMKSFGYEVAGDTLFREMARLETRYRGRSGALALVSSGIEIARVYVRLEEGKIVIDQRSDQPSLQKAKLSDALANLLFQTA